MVAKKFIVEYWNGDLNMIIGIYNSSAEAMGAIMYHVLTTYENGIPEFGVKNTGDSGYDSYFNILISYTKKADGGYDFDERNNRNHIDRYRVFFWRNNFEEE